MSNPNNHGTIVGRLASDPKVFVNADGSKSVRMTVFADRNYTNRDGSRPQADAISLSAYVRPETEGNGVFDRVHKGDLVNVAYNLRMDRFQRNGSEVFEMKVVIDQISFLESRSVTQARLNKRLTEENPGGKMAAEPTEVSETEAAEGTPFVDNEVNPFVG